MTRIIVPNKSIVKPPSFGPRVSVAGFVRMQVIRSDGSIKHDTGEFPNLITDTGMNRMGIANGESGYFFLNYGRCHVGTGNTAPAFTDTALVSPLAQVQAVSGNPARTVSSGSPYWGQTRFQYDFAIGAVVGNVAEVGFSPWSETTAPGNHLSARALIVDEFGAPTTITVLSDELLRVFYTRRVYMNESDVLQTIDISGTPYDTILRPADVDNVYHWARFDDGFIKATGGSFVYSTFIRNGDIVTDLREEPTSTGGYSVAGNGFSVADPYVPGTFYRDVESHYGVTSGNFPTGIKSYTMSCGFGYWQVSFTPAIPKLDTQLLKIKARISWARHTP